MTGKPVDLARILELDAEAAEILRRHPELRGDASTDEWEATLREDDEAMARGDQDGQLVVRMSSETIDRLDAYAERLRKEQPGPAWSRADVVRLLLTRGLDAAEGTKPKKR